MKKKRKEFEEYGTVHPNEEKIVDTVNKSIEIFCLKEQEKMLTYREFLWIQFCVTQKKWWLLQMLLLTGMGFILSYNQEAFYVQRGLGIASVLFEILIIPELWKNRSNQCMEIESASYYSLRQIYSARIFLFGLVDVILVTAFCLFLHGRLHITLLSLLSQFLFPAVVTGCICFGMLCSKKNTSEAGSIALCILWSVIWWSVITNDKIYTLIKLPVWIFLIGIGLVILGDLIYRTIRESMKY